MCPFSNLLLGVSFSLSEDRKVLRAMIKETVELGGLGGLFYIYLYRFPRFELISVMVISPTLHLKSVEMSE